MANGEGGHREKLRCGVEIANFVFLIIGIALAGIGGAAYFAADKLVEKVQLMENFDLVAVAWFCFAVGGAIILTGLTGYCGAKRRVKGCLSLNFLILTTVFLGVAFVGVRFYMSGEGFESFVNAKLEPAFAKAARAKRESSDWMKVVAFQEKMQCCGWSNINKFNVGLCKDQGNALNPDTVFEPAYNIPCRQATYDWYLKWRNPIKGGAAALIFLQVLAMMGSMYIICKHTHNHEWTAHWPKHSFEE